MKRLLFLALGAFFLSVASVAQTDAKAKAIIDRYNTLSGLDKNAANGSALMEVQVAMAMQAIPMKIIKGTETGCFRIEMTVPGQGELLMVTDGKNGWVALKGQPVQALPREAIEQMASQGDVSGTLSVDEKNIDYTYVGASKGIETIEGTPKAESLAAKNFKSVQMAFSESSGLLTSVRMVNAKDQTVEVTVSNYQKFGNVMMPTRMETTVPGAQNAVVTIKNVEFGIPTEAWMFAKPASVN